MMEVFDSRMDTFWTPKEKREEAEKSVLPESLIEKHFEVAEPLAQSVEHRPFKPRVAGSIPARLTSPHRLVVRTPLFQGGDGGSIPPEGTTYLAGSTVNEGFITGRRG